ncbi:MAG: type II toxin-antitoxin system RelE/ParE family toxin [Defluviitaleaceae bacterium]|nr:type II toxin-antitoxin system RelE/ParE family toxin [Defluviitaleaceae bacterium]
MAYNIAYTAFAERDLWEIADYLSEHSIPAMQRLMREVKVHIAGLAFMPFMYPKIDPGREYRKMVVGSYVVVYLPDESLKQITIVRVVHGRRNYQPELKRGLEC